MLMFFILYRMRICRDASKRTGLFIIAVCLSECTVGATTTRRDVLTEIQVDFVARLIQFNLLFTCSVVIHCLHT